MMVVSNAIYSHSFNLSISVEQFILANGISLFIIPFSKIRGKEELFVPIHKNVNFRINISKKSGTPVIIGMASILFIISILGRIFGSQVLSYNLGLHQNSCFLIFILGIVGIIEIYKRIYNRI